jgi:spectinomycin phosphotransferase
MIEKPDINDERIIASLQENYSILVNEIEFLPIGNDASSFAYRVEAGNGNLYFLKIRTNISNFAGLFVPRFLKDRGIKEVIAPIPAATQSLIAEMDRFALILYPFITGQAAMNVGMTDAQWREFGSVLKQIHTMKLDENTLQYVRQESFIPKWSSLSKALHEQANSRNFDNPYQKEFARFWREKNQIVQTLIERTERIGQHLQQANLEFVLCHADIHTANVLLTPEQEMFIVDWDETLLAPKERDLMFVSGQGTIPAPEEGMFFEGYGAVQVNQLVAAYYRYEWCVQEIGDYGQRVFLTEEAGEITKQDALERFIELFSQGDVVEAALNTAVEI